MFRLDSLEDVNAAHGGKAAGLRALSELGLAVPDTVVLSPTSVSELLQGDEFARTRLYDWLTGQQSGLLAVRSSGLQEDGAERSFAGVYDSVLHVTPEVEAVVAAVAKVAASATAARVGSYASMTDVGMAVILQQQVDAACSGVLFTQVLDQHGRACLFAEWTSGLADELVLGRIRPAQARIPLGGHRPIVIDGPPHGNIYPSRELVEAWIEIADRIKQARESDYDVEWAMDRAGKMWCLQLRPISVPVLLPPDERAGGGIGAAPGRAAGPVTILGDDLSAVQSGDVLVATITEADQMEALRRAAAIVTEQGGLLSHAAIVARELSIPCVVGLADATTKLVPGETAEIDGATGEVRQGDLHVGGLGEGDINWRSVYLYNRGFEVAAGGARAFLEFTPGGLIASVDGSLTSEEQRSLDLLVRKRFGTTAPFVPSDRRIWHTEWARFDRLSPVAIMDGLFRQALASWDNTSLLEARAAIKDYAASLKARIAGPELVQLYWSEVGAGLHALIATIVEGRAIWQLYQATAAVRLDSARPLLEVMSEVEELGVASLAGASDCIASLADLRNEAFEFFTRVGAFAGSYFQDREGLIDRAAPELGLQLEGSESDRLDVIYASQHFKALDRQARTDLMAWLASR